MTTIATDELRGLIEAELASLIELRRAFHREPEVMFTEERTSERVQKELEALGLAFRSGIGGQAPGTGTGVVAHLPATGEAKACVGLRADMDALPIEENTGVPYASQTPGVMHACGHDGHTTILVGAARVLSKLSGRPNAVTFVFQPAEEGGAGGEKMIRDGALDGGIQTATKGDIDLGPAVTRMHGLHGWPDLPLGHIASRPGPLLAATDEFDVVIRGTQCHAAFPHKGTDPVVATAQIVNALQTIASRNVSPVDAVVVTVGAIHGGSAHNVIPGEVSIRGTVRSLNNETRAHAKRRFFEIVEGTAKSLGCAVEIDWEDGYPVTFNDPQETARCLSIAEDALGDARVHRLPEPFMGGEDFAYYGLKVPSSFFVLGLCPDGADPATRPQLHQPEFDFNDDAIATGVEMMVRLALAEG